VSLIESDFDISRTAEEQASPAGKTNAPSLFLRSETAAEPLGLPSGDAPSASSGNTLFLLCGDLLKRILASLPVMPYGIRAVAAALARPSDQSSHHRGHSHTEFTGAVATSPVAQSPASGSSAAAVESRPIKLVPGPIHSREQSQSRPQDPTAEVVIDFVFLNWLVNAVMFPESYALTGMFPVTTTARRNLQVRISSDFRFDLDICSP